MKKKITSLLFMLTTLFVFSQNCDETNNAVLNGEIYDYHLEDCTSDVSINTPNGNTNMHGIMLIDAITSINLKPTGNNKIIIKPDGEMDFINLLATSEFKSVRDYINDYAEKTKRTTGGNSELEAKGPDGLKIYPTPVETILTIENGEAISYYKILTDYGLTVKEGTTPGTELFYLNLSALTEGTYYLLLQAEGEILLTRIYKN